MHPNKGSKRLNHEARIHVVSGANLTLVWDAKLGHTGRTIRGNEGYAFADVWAKLDTREDLLSHPACQEFSSLVRDTPLIEDNALVFFRGRGIGGSPPS